jgi:hypothetical protein
VPDVPPDAIDRARALLGDFTEGRWERARGKLHKDMRGHPDVVGHIADWWAHPDSPAGGFERAGDPSARQSGDYTIVELPLTFRAGQGLGRVAVDQQGKVGGLSVEYPRRHRFDPRPVRILASGIPGTSDPITVGRRRHARRLRVMAAALETVSDHFKRFRLPARRGHPCGQPICRRD